MAAPDTLGEDLIDGNKGDVSIVIDDRWTKRREFHIDRLKSNGGNRVGHKFKVVTNIRGASISNELGLVAIEMEGSRPEIDRAVTWLRSQGIQVEPIEKNVIE